MRACLALACLVTIGGAAAAGTVPAGSPQMPVWSNRDYSDFYFLHWNGNHALPHLRTPASKAVFETMVAHGNIDRIMGEGISLREKQFRLDVILSSLGGLRAAYNYQAVMGEPLQEELARVQEFMLFVIDARMSLGADSPGAEAWKTAALGVAQSLSERTLYDNAQTILLADALAQHYPTLSRILDASDRSDLQERIGRLAAAETDAAVRRSLLALLSTIAEN